MKEKHKGPHPEKMCARTCCWCAINLEELKPLVNNAKYICEFCGRVANDSQYLCKPAKI